jgi:hypothetical protein
MSKKTIELLHIVDMLPETEQNFINEMIKRVVIAWDPDFTKLTAEEIELLRQSDEELQRGETFSEDDIDWN